VASLYQIARTPPRIGAFQFSPRRCDGRRERATRVEPAPAGLGELFGRLARGDPSVGVGGVAAAPADPLEARRQRRLEPKTDEGDRELGGEPRP